MENWNFKKCQITFQVIINTKKKKRKENEIKANEFENENWSDSHWNQLEIEY